ncbi:hypothetical protein B0T21DRAFT_390378 [Apiosordaria backusii]|uniref:Developmental regulatory protein wetA n=1 Tax=Apiosordaria backusii TaxID=314023 RepID=A0AA40ETI9_9PEZI|nr:hypothetical protein B0T21DRAFT_390378 [Apiosordaria backusii]
MDHRVEATQPFLGRTGAHSNMRPSSTNVLNTPRPPMMVSIPCVAVAGWVGLLTFFTAQPLHQYQYPTTPFFFFFLSLSLPHHGILEQPTLVTTRHIPHSTRIRARQEDLQRPYQQTAIRYRPRPTMAGVEGMAFMAGGLPLAGNKEGGSFYSHDVDEAGSTDFFDQFVMLDGSDSETTAEGGGGLGQFCGASGLPVSPQLSSIEPSLSMPTTGTGSASGRTAGAGGAAGNHGNFGPSGGRTMPLDNLSGNANGSNLNGNHGGGAGTGGWQGAVNSPIIARPHQFQQQQAQRLQRATTNIGDHKMKPDIEIDGLPFTTSGFGEPLGGGTVSDSELLKLEGLSMRTTKVEVPQPAASVPPSPTPLGSSPKKSSRLGAFCSRFRSKAVSTLHGKSKQQQVEIKQASSMSTPVISSAQMGGGAVKSESGRPRPVNLDLSKSQLPLSPPLTGAMPASSQPQTISGNQLMNGNNNNNMNFVNGFLDDPFLTDQYLRGGQFVPPLQLSNGATNGNMPHTPLQTPLIDGIPAAWQLPVTSPGFVMSPNGEINSNWWDTAGIDAMDTDPITNLFPSNTTTATNPRDASLNLAMHFPHNSFEYPAPPGTDDFSVSNNLMLHMPQPRGPNAAVLHPQYRAQQQQQQQSSSSSRRPKPRAPSSGARHHHYTGNGTSGSGMSPRKTRTASGSSTTPFPTTTTSSKASAGGPPGGRLHRRSASMQMLPNHHHHHPHNPSLSSPGTLLDPPGAGSTPSAIRKRRSWTGRRVSHSSSQVNLNSLLPPNGQSASSSSRGHKSTRRTASCSSLAALAGMNGMDGGGGGLDGGGGGGGGSFVNYTPQDKQLLMTGVAPSGSSKTKLRREKEAKEKAREFKERLARAVEAAGGDLERLKEVEEGLALV